MIEGKHRESTAIAQLCKSTVDLREEVARLEDALQAAQSQIAASQARECRMQEALERAPDAHSHACDALVGGPCNCWQKYRKAALSASGPCPHKAEADARLKQFVTQVSMDHAAICEWEAEVERLKALCRRAEAPVRCAARHTTLFTSDEWLGLADELRAAGEGRDK